MTDNWIVMAGQPVDTTGCGGFEFFGPFSETEADYVRQEILRSYQGAPGSLIAIAIQLLRYPIAHLGHAHERT